jgi:inorganic pyrophosphatase
VKPGEEVTVVIEVSRGDHTKRGHDGRVEVFSPIPCPYNYGSVPGTVAGDGEPVDAIVIGPRLPRGATVRTRVRAIARFVDEGLDDPKLVCKAIPLTGGEITGLKAFFRIYAAAKNALGVLQRGKSPTRFEGIE